MNKIILSLAAVLFSALTANAVITQQVTLKNGTVLYGYIQQQDMKGNMVFHTEKAIVSLSGKNVESITNEREYKLSDLNSKWKKWAEENNIISATDKNAVLTLCDVITKNERDTVADSAYSGNETYGTLLNNAYKVRILERGKNVKYLELTPNTYNIKRKDIASIKAEKRDKDMLSGINRIYTLKNGREIEGEYAGETSNTLSLFGKGGVVETFDTNDVIKYTFKPVNPAQDIFEQSPLTDIVKTKNNGSIRGVIIEQNYSGKTDKENYILIKQQPDVIQSVKISDISEIRREENTRYNPKKDIILKKDEVMINRIPAIQTDVREDEEHDMLVIDSIARRIVINKETGMSTTIAVEFNSGYGTGKDRFQLVRVNSLKKKRDTIYYFSYKDLAMYARKAYKEEKSVNNTMRMEYTVSGTGIFVLYDAISRKAFPFEVK